jgi:hypothetical protein
MLINYLYLIKCINATINLSDTDAFKYNKLILSEKEVKYLENYVKIFQIFIKAITKLSRVGSDLFNQRTCRIIRRKN